MSAALQQVKTREIRDDDSFFVAGKCCSSIIIDSLRTEWLSFDWKLKIIPSVHKNSSSKSCRNHSVDLIKKSTVRYPSIDFNYTANSRYFSIIFQVPARSPMDQIKEKKKKSNNNPDYCLPHIKANPKQLDWHLPLSRLYLLQSLPSNAAHIRELSISLSHLNPRTLRCMHLHIHTWCIRDNDSARALSLRGPTQRGRERERSGGGFSIDKTARARNEIMRAQAPEREYHHRKGTYIYVYECVGWIRSLLSENLRPLWKFDWSLLVLSFLWPPFFWRGLWRVSFWFVRATLGGARYKLLEK